jgi:hypothetical protein
MYLEIEWTMRVDYFFDEERVTVRPDEEPDNFIARSKSSPTTANCLEVTAGIAIR